MVDGRSDAELVAAYLGGERDALAGIYDRYADRLYDTASAMLHDPHEAADATQDVFLTATEKLGQLRDTTRLKPWLFAILRHEVFRRSKRRQRVRPVDLSTAAEVVAPDDPAAEGATAVYAELARSVRDAAAGLDTRDQLVLELTARQGLSGDELADALGVGVDHSHVLVHRMRDRVERSLGALAVARTGRRDCAELNRLLADWDGELTVLLRKRIARHIEGCDICSRTKQRYGAFALVAAAPALAAPPELRPRVLERAALPRSGRRWPVVVATVAAVTLLAIGAGVGLAVVTGGDEVAAPAPPTLPAVASSTTPATTVTTSPPPPSTTVTPTTIAPATTTASTTPTTEPAAGRLELSDGVVDLGATESTAELVLANSGGSPISWTLADDSVFGWSATAGQLEPGEAIEVTVSIDRSNLPEGDVEGVTTIESDGGGAAVELRAQVERPPTVDIVRAPRSVPCQTSVPPIVAATADDDSELDQVVLSWSGPGDSGETNMDTDGSGAWAGRLTIEPVAGTWDVTVTATDVRGNVGSSSGTVEVTGC